MPVRNRRLNKFIKRGHEKSQEPQALKASPWGDPCSSMPGKSLLRKGNFCNASESNRRPNYVYSITLKQSVKYATHHRKTFI